MRISDWSSDVCSSDLVKGESAFSRGNVRLVTRFFVLRGSKSVAACNPRRLVRRRCKLGRRQRREFVRLGPFDGDDRRQQRPGQHLRSEEHTSELQSLMRISYAVFCLKKKKQD